MSNKKDIVTRSFYYYDISLFKYKSKNLVRIDNQEANFYKIFNQIKNIQKVCGVQKFQYRSPSAAPPLPRESSKGQVGLRGCGAAGLGMAQM